MPEGCGSGFCVAPECCIGDDEAIDSIPPIEIGGKAAAFSKNGNGAVVLLEDGSVRSAGAVTPPAIPGAPMPLGDDELLTSVPPVDLGGAAIAIASRIPSACVVLEGGDVRCWGATLDLIYGTDEDYFGDDEHPRESPLIPLAGRATKVALGLAHACALLETGQVQCWGRNHYGQLGYPGIALVGEDVSLDDVGFVELD